MLWGIQMTSSYKLACERMQKRPLNPIGTCFDFVAHQVLCNEDLPSNAYICHGIGISNMPGQEGEIMAHAWIEFHDEEHGTIAADTTWDEMRYADLYRKTIQARRVVQYSQKEFMQLWQDFEYPGPWDYEIKQVIKSYSNKGKKNVKRSEK